MLFFRSKGVATPLLRKNRKKKTLNLQHYPQFIATYINSYKNEIFLLFNQKNIIISQRLTLINPIFMLLRISLLFCCLLVACQPKISKNEIPKKIQGLKTMQLISGGFFRQGSEKGTAAEKPVRTVAVTDFYIDATPVTYQDYKLYAELGKVHNAQWYDENYHQHNLPVTGITWHQAADFCNWRSEIEGLQPVYQITNQHDDYGYPIFVRNELADGYRLPTEAEFEYAAACGETQQVFPWGEKFEHKFANFDIEKRSSKGKWRRLAPVDSLYCNAWGLFGMSGNQWHWCDDWFGADAYSQTSNLQNPTFDLPNGLKAIRGGSWGSPSDVFLTVYKRSYTAAGNYNFDIGFRCVRQVKTTSIAATLPLKKPEQILHKYYREENYFKTRKFFEGNVYSEKFIATLGQYLADYYPNCLYFHLQVDKQAVITPRKMAELIIKVSKQYQIHPLLLTGIFAAESGFGSCSVPRWYNNPLAYHWQNKLISKGEPEYHAPIGKKNEKFATLQDAFHAFCKGIRKSFYLPVARQNLAAFHKLYVGYDAHAWMLPISRIYRDLLGVKITANYPETEVGKLIYLDWEKFKLQ
jgi:sulfatase modifying factor 1